MAAPEREFWDRVMQEYHRSRTDLERVQRIELIWRIIILALFAVGIPLLCLLIN